MLTAEQIVTKFEEEFNLFLEAKQRSQWLHVGDGIVQVYCRKAFHLIHDEMIDTLDIANITIEAPGHGFGTAVINLIHHKNPFPVTYIENVLGDRFYEHLVRNGWEDVDRIRSIQQRSRCVYKETDKSKLLKRVYELT